MDWDELREYISKEDWRVYGLERGMGDLDDMRELESAGAGGVVGLEGRWGKGWQSDRMVRCVKPSPIY